MTRTVKSAQLPSSDSSPDFQQAESPGVGSRFLQIVAKPRRNPKKEKSKKEPKLTRVAFKVSRLMEFCTKRELQNQTGHAVEDWPLVVLKELMDNALDACEEAEVAPVVSIAVEPGSITIQDNGGGIKTTTVKSVLDYSIRVSSREAYVSPTRGAQGNALKTILAMGYVLDRELCSSDQFKAELRDALDRKHHGRSAVVRAGAEAEAVGITIIESRGTTHHIEFRVDHVNNEPRITHTVTPSPLNTGTRITVKWPPRVEWDGHDFMRLAESYVWFNPHLTLCGTWNGREFINVIATNPDWKKWGPRNPTSAHWYDETRLQRYLAAHVARDRDYKRHRTVREFISEFRGLSGTAIQRKVLEEVGCSHQSLMEFFGIDQVNRKGIAKLLASMCKHTKPVAAKHLGIIGAEHLKRRFLAAGGNADTFKYQQRRGATKEGIPYIVEFAFGLHESGLKPEALVMRRIVTGANWSVGINNPFRAFGSTGEGLENTLAQVRASASAPVICALHLASAYIQFADRGKSSIILTDNASPNG